MGITTLKIAVVNPGERKHRTDGHRGASPVIFGQKGDANIVGAVTLESLGLMLDPLKRKLRPAPMLLV